MNLTFSLLPTFGVNCILRPAIKIADRLQVEMAMDLNPQNLHYLKTCVYVYREWTEGGQLWVQQVSSTPATRLDVITLQEELDRRLQQRQARETGICPVRRELYSQCFGNIKMHAWGDSDAVLYTIINTAMLEVFQLKHHRPLYAFLRNYMPVDKHGLRITLAIFRHLTVFANTKCTSNMAHVM